MFTVLKSWLLGAPAPLYLSATPATGRLPLAEQQNDEVSIAFIRADVNAPSAAARGHGRAVVEIYRGRQSREEYLGEWLGAQAEVGRQVRSSTAGNGRGDTGGQPSARNGRGDTGGQPPPRCGEARVPTASHDRREALRLHNRRNPPARPLRPGRLRGPQKSGDTSMDLDRPARNPPPGREPCLSKHAVHISRCLTELGQDEPSGSVGMVSIGTLAGIEALGLSRSIQDMGRGW